MSKIDIGISEQDRESIAGGLKHLLADSYTLYLQTHNFHWNVTGPQFRDLHLLFEEHYTELAVAVDDIAERIRTLGVNTDNMTVLGLGISNGLVALSGALVAQNQPSRGAFALMSSGHNCSPGTLSLTRHLCLTERGEWRIVFLAFAGQIGIVFTQIELKT